jgi:hypothetical protein
MTEHARPPRRTPARGRALLVFGLVAGAIGVGLTVSAFGGGGDAPVTLDVEDAAASSAPATVAPIIVAESPDEPASDPGVPGSVATTIPLSPLAELLGPSGSAIPRDIQPRLRPASLTIDDLDLWGPIRGVGLEDDGQLEIPDETEIGWYRYGAAPGYEGATVLAAHVTWNGTIGPFHRLGDLDPGALVEVTLEDGSTRTYEVVERTMYNKDALPRDRIWRNTGDETLVLITCGGDFNPEIRRYRQNIVVYAVPVA